MPGPLDPDPPREDEPTPGALVEELDRHTDLLSQQPPAPSIFEASGDADRRSSFGTSSPQTRVFIVRHAEHVSPDSLVLSSAGSLQATALAETFRQQAPFKCVYTSPRAMETAQIIAAALGVPVLTDERLKNWDAGVALGLSKKQVQERLPEVYQQRYVLRAPTYQVPEGESLQQRYDRVSAFLDEIVAKFKDSQVIVVTHGGIIDDMFRIACSIPLPQVTGLMKPYGCVSVLVHNDSGWQEKQWAKADHLPRVVAESPSGGHLYLFPHQVSGSFPLLRGDRGELCKPATARELSFYEALFAPDASDAVKALAAHVPKFLGTSTVALDNLLALTPHTQPRALHQRSFSVSKLWATFAEERHKKMIQAEGGRLVYLILENLTHGMVRPHILDVKMGIRTHRNGESADKILRKIEKAQSSTSKTMGVRLQGLHAYDANGALVVRDKYSCRTLDAQGLKSCIQLFDAGKCDRKSIRDQLVQLRQTVERVSWRFYGSSVLMVFDSSNLGRPPRVCLIDFGSGEFNEDGSPGCDKGLLLGIDSLLKIFGA